MVDVKTEKMKKDKVTVHRYVKVIVQSAEF